MSAPLKAGERLAPGTPPRAHSPQRDPRRVPPRPRKRRRHLFRALLAGTAGLCVVVMCAAGGVAYFAWSRFNADIPSVDGLRAYQPPVLSRVYAGNGQLIAELASERRIFVPYGAIPPKVSAAFIAAEDQNFGPTRASIWVPSRGPACSTWRIWAMGGGRSVPPRSRSRWRKTCC